jgi:hypothetical protein
MSRLVRCGLLLVWLALFAPACASLVSAQPASEDRATSFEAVSGPVKEDIAGGPLMLGAYAAVWLAVFGNVFRMLRLHRSLQGDLERVERAVGAAGKDAH